MIPRGGYQTHSPIPAGFVVSSGCSFPMVVSKGFNMKTIYVRGVGEIPINYNMIAVFGPQIAASRAYDHNYEVGQIDRKHGEPCRSANGAYLDGWYSVPNPRNGVTP